MEHTLYSMYETLRLLFVVASIGFECNKIWYDPNAEH